MSTRLCPARSEAALAEAGWRFCVVWECALKGRARLPLLDVLEACAAWLRSQEPRLEIRGQAE
jgi:DNA mismatch endonuclease (patch repair protein)